MSWRAFADLPGHVRSRDTGAVIVYDYERGLLYRKGVFQRVLMPGRYRIWPFTGDRIVLLDVRRSNLHISNQKLLTADQITVTLNVLAIYQVTDPAAALRVVHDYLDQLYADAQLAMRAVIGSETIDVLLGDRGDLGARVLADLKAKAAEYGVDVSSVGIKDVIVAPRVRDLLMREAEAKRIAQATLVAAREEVAAMRALANAARIAEQHPSLLRLRELDTVRSVAQAGGNTVVLGVGGTPNIAASGAPVSERAAPEVDAAEDADQ